MLGFGRAMGEAIAVSLVIGDVVQIKINQFLPGVAMASQIATQFPAPDNKWHLSALYYLGVILLVFSVLTNLAARRIARHSERFA